MFLFCSFVYTVIKDMIGNALRRPKLRLKDASMTNLERIDRAWLLVQSSMRKRDYNTAIYTLHYLLKFDRRNPAVYNRLGIIHAKNGSLERSTKFFKKSLKYEKSMAGFHNLGLIYFERGLYKKSLIYFQKALSEEETADRHIIISRVYQQLDNNDKVIEHLRVALQYADTKALKERYLKTLKAYTATTISQEILDALTHNKLPWEYKALEEYELLLANMRTLHAAVNDLLTTLDRKRLSPRTKHTKELAIIFLHHYGACEELLEKNYSHAASNIGRIVFEIYLKIAYAVATSNRAYAEFELYSLIKRREANSRMIQSLEQEDSLTQSLRRESREIKKRISALKKRYKNLAPPPSFRRLAIGLDGGTLGRNYLFYVNIYQVGSSSTHSEREFIRRAVELSGTHHAGIFNDSHSLTKELTDLIAFLGHKITLLPEVSSAARQKYQRSIRKINPNYRSGYFRS